MAPIKKSAEPAAKAKTKKTPIKQTMKKIKIFDMNVHCQTEVFKYLDVNDLVNASIVWKNTKPALRDVFARKFGNDVITITNFRSAPDSGLPPTPILRRFGNLITKLKVQYNREYPRHCTEMERQILKHCRKTVLEIEFVDCDREAFEDIKSPFPLVEKVTFTRCAPNKLVYEFTKWFPNARSLDINESFLETKDFTCIEKRFPRLQHLGIGNSNFFSKSALSSFLEAIKVNGQLKSVRLEEDSNLFEDFALETFLDLVNTRLPGLEVLNVNTSRFDYDSDSNVPKVEFKELKNLKITADGSMENFPVHCEQLEILSLAGGYYHLDVEFIRDIGPNEKLVLGAPFMCPCGGQQHGFDEWLRSVETIPRLKQIEKLF